MFVDFFSQSGEAKGTFETDRITFSRKARNFKSFSLPIIIFKHWLISVFKGSNVALRSQHFNSFPAG
jgi:hypothetical protein